MYTLYTSGEKYTTKLKMEYSCLFLRAKLCW